MDTTMDTSRRRVSAEPHGTMPAPATVRIERLLPGTAERVWAYLTESEKRSKWLAAGPFDLKAGGKIELTFRNNDLSEDAPKPTSSPDGVDHLLQGKVLRCEPTKLLVFTWGVEENASEVTFELSPEDGNTRLVVTHRRLSGRGQLLGVSAGWHAHIGILIDVLSNEKPRAFWSEHAKLEQAYKELFPE
ncbi:SRPBCC family protein [Corticibacterium sp. UT-5YL-CI-8]|nr:SRPBCC family protein [Tianweitania sp. UT-5YL-CI-8]